MDHIFLQKVIDGLQGILVGGGIEIQGAPQEMSGRVGNKKLMGGGGIPPYIEKNTPYPIGGPDQGLIDRRSLVCVFKGHLEGVIPELFEAVVSYVLVADVDLCVEPGEIDVDPVGVLGFYLEEGAVLYHVGIHGVFEGIRIARLVEGAILVPGQVDLKVSSSFGVVIAVTGREKGQCYADGTKYSRSQFKDSFLR